MAIPEPWIPLCMPSFTCHCIFHSFYSASLPPPPPRAPSASVILLPCLTHIHPLLTSPVSLYPTPVSPLSLVLLIIIPFSLTPLPYFVQLIASLSFVPSISTFHFSSSLLPPISHKPPLFLLLPLHHYINHLSFPSSLPTIASPALHFLLHHHQPTIHSLPHLLPQSQQQPSLTQTLPHLPFIPCLIP